jgi:hypothetical protein
VQESVFVYAGEYVCAVECVQESVCRRVRARVSDQESVCVQAECAQESVQRKVRVQESVCQCVQESVCQCVQESVCQCVQESVCGRVCAGECVSV